MTTIAANTETVVMPPPARQLAAKIPEPVAERLAQLGRTEDLRFSPDGRRLAIAGFNKGSCLILDVDVTGTALGPTVSVSGALEITSEALNFPHGFDFIGNDRLVVANREGTAVIFRLPAEASGVVALGPETVLRRSGLFKRLGSPGSVVALAEPDGHVSLMICENYNHRVSLHRLRPGQRAWRIKSRILYENGMEIPDGIAVTPDRSLVAVSSHNTRSVLIYPWNRWAGRKSWPVATLTGMSFPHGLRFTNDGARLFVADAGSPAIYVFDRPDTGWHGNIWPVANFAPITEQVFRAGRSNPQEGGPKGLDFDPTGQVLGVTNERQPLAFFDARALPIPALQTGGPLA